MDRIGRRIILTFLLLLAGVGLLLSVIINEYAGENQCKIALLKFFFMDWIFVTAKYLLYLSELSFVKVDNT